jgi:hypothetical protein
MRVSNVHILQYLRDVTLGTIVGEDLSQRIAANNPNKFATIQLKKSAFLDSYERHMYQLEKLTPTQEAVREQYHGELNRQRNAQGWEIPTILLDGAAGTGKSFLGLHDMLLALERGQRVLFVARNAALSYFVAVWACRRLRLSMTEKEASAKMANLSTLSLNEGRARLRRCHIDEKTSEISFVDTSPMYPSVADRLLLHCEEVHMLCTFTRKCCTPLCCSIHACTAVALSLLYIMLKLPLRHTLLFSQDYSP